MGAILLFLAAHLPYFYWQFPEDLSELLRILFLTLVTLVGIRLIAELRRAVKLVEQREREIAAHAQLNLRMLNERVELLEEATRRGERLQHLYRMIAMASRARSPLDMARDFLHLVQEEVGVEYASLTLVNPDGSLGERVDNFRGIEPFPVSARPGGMAESILKTGETQYIGDTLSDARSNPALVQAGIRSYLGIPLKVDGELAGILFLHSTRTQALREEREFLESIALMLAVPLQRTILLAQVDRERREWDTAVNAIDVGLVVTDEGRKIIRANEAFA
jgi:transcriptional regulator with GAF, ATPase, and Fis domain